MAKTLSPRDACLLLGYDLERNRTDAMGNRWQYAAYPVEAGGINYFDNQADVVEWTKQVAEIRRWEAEAIEEAE